MPCTAEEVISRRAGQMNSSMNSINPWEHAEAWLDGSLSLEDTQALQLKMEQDPAFAAEFQENIDLIQSLRGAGGQQRFRATLGEIHTSIKQPAKKVHLIKLPPYFWRTAAVAATVALVTSLISYTLFVNTAQKTASQYSTISREVEHIKRVQARQQEQQNAIIDSFKKKNLAIAPPSEVRYTGTGFALTNDGYFVTAYHVINNGNFDSVYIQCSDDKYYKAILVNYNSNTDLAILKVDHRNFHFGKGEVPYSIVPGRIGLGARIFTLGYPKDDIVYSEGYVSARAGFNGNEQQYTLELPAGHGQSGSPVIDGNGNISAILTAISGPEEANTYAVGSKALVDLFRPLLADNKIRLPRGGKLGKLSREEQIARMESYTFSVKVYKK